MYVDDHGEVVQTIMTSVEATSEVKTDAKMGFEEGMLDDAAYANVGHAISASRESLGSIAEVVQADEKRMDLDFPQQDEAEPDGSAKTIASGTTPSTAKRRRKWSQSEIHHVGAWLDAGYEAEVIVGLFDRKFPDAERITTGMVTRRRSVGLKTKEYEEVLAFGRELGLESGKWRSMVRKMRDELFWNGIQKRALDVMARHQGEWNAGNRELQSSLHDGAMGGRLCLKMRELFMNQRTEWRAFRKKAVQHVGLFQPEWFRIGQGDAEIHLSQLSELVQQANDRVVGGAFHRLHRKPEAFA